jgi:hypothetical protein
LIDPYSTAYTAWITAVAAIVTSFMVGAFLGVPAP